MSEDIKKNKRAVKNWLKLAFDYYNACRIIDKKLAPEKNKLELF